MAKRLSIGGEPTSSNFVQIFLVTVQIEKAIDLVKADTFGKSDPYCKAIAQGKIFKTKCILKTLDPVWEEQTTFCFFENPKEIRFEVWDWDKGSKDDQIGDATLQIGSFFNKGHKGFSGTLDLVNVKRGQLSVKVICRKVLPMELEQRARSLQEKLQQQNDTLIQNKQTQRDLDQNIMTLKMGNDHLRETNQVLQQTTNDLQVKLNQLNSDKDMAEKELKELEDRTNELQEENDQLEKEREGLEQEIVSKTRSLDDLSTEIEMKVNEVKDARTRLSEYEKSQQQKLEHESQPLVTTPPQNVNEPQQPTKSGTTNLAEPPKEKQKCCAIL